MWSFLIKKDGKNSSQNQIFKCKDFSKKFTFKSKSKAETLLTSYITEKKNLNTLAKDAKKSVSSIKRALKSIEIAKPQKLENIKEIILLIDTTYWGKNFGVVVFKDAISGKFIWWHFIKGRKIRAL